MIFDFLFDEAHTKKKKKKENGISEAEKPKKSPQPNYPEPILVY